MKASLSDVILIVLSECMIQSKQKDVEEGERGRFIGIISLLFKMRNSAGIEWRGLDVHCG